MEGQAEGPHHHHFVILDVDEEEWDAIPAGEALEDLDNFVSDLDSMAREHGRNPTPADLERVTVLAERAGLTKFQLRVFIPAHRLFAQAIASGRLKGPGLDGPGESMSEDKPQPGVPGNLFILVCQWAEQKTNAGGGDLWCRVVWAWTMLTALAFLMPLLGLFRIGKKDPGLTEGDQQG